MCHRQGSDIVRSPYLKLLDPLLTIISCENRPRKADSATCKMMANFSHGFQLRGSVAVSCYAADEPGYLPSGSSEG